MISRSEVTLPDAHTHVHHVQRAVLSEAHTFVDHTPRAVELVAAAARARIGPVVVCATSPDDMDAVLHLRDAAPPGAVLAGLGIHPACAGRFADPASLQAAIDSLRAHLVRDSQLHVGEIGVDKAPRALAQVSLDVQLSVLRAQLELAAALGRAVSVHCVRAFPELVECFQGVSLRPPPESPPGAPAQQLAGVLLHSWGGSLAQAHAILAALPPGTLAAFSFQGDCVWSVAEAFERALGPLVGGAPVDDAAAGALTASASPEAAADQEASCECGAVPLAARGVSACSDPEPRFDAGALPSRASDPASAKGPPELPAPPVPSAGFRGANTQTLAALAQLPATALAFETDAPWQPFPSSPRYDAWCHAVFGEAGVEGGQTPLRVARVAQAAAVWRCLHTPAAVRARAKGGRVLQGAAGGAGGGVRRGGGPAAHEGGGDAPSEALAGVPAHLSPPPGAGWPSPAAVRAELAELTRHAAANVARIFGGAATRTATPVGPPVAESH